MMTRTGVCPDRRWVSLESNMARIWLEEGCILISSIELFSVGYIVMVNVHAIVPVEI